jgi:hypothetical protein
MNFQFYLEKLEGSENFKNFKKEFPEAFLCSGFFSIDKQGKDNQQHLDFYIPGKKEGFSFKLESESQKIPLENFQGEKLEKINADIDFEFNEMEEIISKKMEEENIKNKIQKFLFSLQSKDGKNFLLGTIFISGLGILKATIDLDKKEITNFEKKSFMDFMKVIRKPKNDDSRK